MNRGTVILSHGLQSGPGATKVTHLAREAESVGWNAVCVDCQGVMDADERIRRVLATAEGERGPMVLAGSSLGGWVSAAASARLDAAALFLMAPAFHLPGLPEAAPSPQAGIVVIIHGWRDDVVPVDNAIRYARDHRAELHLVDDDHRLGGHLPALSGLLRHCLERV